MFAPFKRLIGERATALFATVSHWRDRLPADCPLCLARAAGGRLCLACEADLASLARHAARDGLPWRCARCALPLPEHDAPCPDCAGRATAFDRTVIAFDYAPPGDALVLQMKAGRRHAMAGVLGNLLAEAVRHHDAPLPPDLVLVPVPGGGASLRERGFNSAAEIARALGRDLGLPVRLDLAWRTRDQGKQSALQRGDRLEAVQGLYACAPAVAGMRLGLVDDVMTTGSTVHALAAAMKAAGAQAVVALVAARTPHIPENSPQTGYPRQSLRN